MQDQTTATSPSRGLVRTRHAGIYKRGSRYVVRFRDASGAGYPYRGLGGASRGAGGVRAGARNLRA